MHWSIHILLMVTLFVVMPTNLIQKLVNIQKKDCKINDFQIIF